MITTRLSELSIMVPVYSEERTVERVLSDLLGLVVDFPLEIILVDNGPSDRTPEKIKKLINALIFYKNLILERICCVSKKREFN